MKALMLTLTSPIQYGIRNFRQNNQEKQRKRRHPNQKGRSKIASVWIRHYKEKTPKVLSKTFVINILIQQSCKIQNQYTKMSCFCHSRTT